MQDKGFSWVDFLAYAVDDVDVDAPSVDDAMGLVVAPLAED